MIAGVRLPVVVELTHVVHLINVEHFQLSVPIFT